MIFSSNIKYFTILTAIILLFACDDLDKSAIPDSPVYLERNINSEAMELRAAGGYKTYTIPEKYGDAIGFGGLVLICSFNNDGYHAFDLACPKEVDRNVRVVPNDAGQAACPTCGSVFSIGYGSGNRVSGPAKEGLRKYQITTYTTVSGTFIRVTR
jgi:nitrite reductase/ring-hydroxylating ferredoxin subunit